MTGARRPPRLLLVTGMSGAGKSTVLDALEDMGWDVVDNLPADLLDSFVHGTSQCRTIPAAVGMDVRSRGFDAERLPELFRSMGGVEPERGLGLPRIAGARKHAPALAGHAYYLPQP